MLKNHYDEPDLRRFLSGRSRRLCIQVGDCCRWLTRQLRGWAAIARLYAGTRGLG